MRIGILACSKTKARAPCRADQLYHGHVFRAAARLLRALGCSRLVILSAKHGAIDEATLVEPYNRSLIGAPKAVRVAWATRARAQLAALVPPDAEVVAIVPADYAPALDGLPRVRRLFVGLPVGRLQSALLAAARNAGAAV